MRVVFLAHLIQERACDSGVAAPSGGPRRPRLSRKINYGSIADLSSPSRLRRFVLSAFRHLLTRTLGQRDTGEAGETSARSHLFLPPCLHPAYAWRRLMRR